MGEPVIQIGEYSLSPGYSDGRIWIQHSSGEGGDFDSKKLEEAITKFFNDNF